MKNKKKLPGVIVILTALAVVIISFTPFVIPSNIYKPELFGLPYSLWMGILMTIILVALTWISTKVHPEAREEIKKEKKTSL